MFLLDTYYRVKPYIPRSIQLFVRKLIAQRKRRLFEAVWPIDKSCCQKPDGWKGWPGDKQFAFILSHDVDTQKGMMQSLELASREADLGFFSSFNFVPEKYRVPRELREALTVNGFEVAVHGLVHDGLLFSSKRIFDRRAARINAYLKDWNAVGFHSPSMHRNLDWIHDLNIEYDQSTFDTDPFEPQQGPVATLFPFIINGKPDRPYVELPYTLPQDFTLFVLLREKGPDIWKEKLDWIATQGGMALVNTHPCYMNMNGSKLGPEEYPVEYYLEFLEYVKTKYSGSFYHAPPKDVAKFWKKIS